MKARFILTTAILLAACAGGKGSSTARTDTLLEALSESTVSPSMAIDPAAAEPDGSTEIGGVVRMDKTVHDFGDVTTSDGPLSCTFTLTNISDSPIAIYEVTKTCGCTDVSWTREPLQPGKSGKIEVTYANSDGAYPFEKALSVYVSGLKRHFVLKIRGVVHEKALPLEEMYPVRRGDLGLKGEIFRAGNLEQDESRSEQTFVANLGKKPITISFKDLSPELSVSVTPNPIPAGKTARMDYTVKANRSLWGLNKYTATPLVNGAPAGGPITFTAATKENFTSWSDEDLKAGAQPVFTESTFSFGTVAPGTRVDAEFSYTNKGRSGLRIYKVDSDAPEGTKISFTEAAEGKKGKVNATLDTSGLPGGETVVMLTVYTNSPLRPIVNLFIVGLIR